MTQKLKTQGRRSRRDGVVVLICVGAIMGMVGLVSISPTLYRLFCAATGFGGATRADLDGANLDSRADGAGPAASTRRITVRFDANVSGGLPWAFAPERKEMDVVVGERNLAFFRAASQADVDTIGNAVFNVTPDKAGYYFVKIACFCFDEQVLEAGRAVDMPVSFYVDPEIESDPNLDDVTTITLSYTFFPKPGSLRRSGAEAGAAAAKGRGGDPDVGAVGGGVETSAIAAARADGGAALN